MLVINIKIQTSDVKKILKNLNDKLNNCNIDNKGRGHKLYARECQNYKVGHTATPCHNTKNNCHTYWGLMS